MKYSWKIKQYINQRNNIKHKTLDVGEEFIKYSQWKCDSITSTMRGIYKSRNNEKKYSKYIQSNET